jgi:hypothetical protein
MVSFRNVGYLLPNDSPVRMLVGNFPDIITLTEEYALASNSYYIETIPVKIVFCHWEVHRSSGTLKHDYVFSMSIMNISAKAIKTKKHHHVNKLEEYCEDLFLKCLIDIDKIYSRRKNISADNRNNPLYQLLESYRLNYRTIGDKCCMEWGGYSLDFRKYDNKLIMYYGGIEFYSIDAHNCKSGVLRLLHAMDDGTIPDLFYGMPLPLTNIKSLTFNAKDQLDNPIVRELLCDVFGDITLKFTRFHLYCDDTPCYRSTNLPIDITVFETLLSEGIYFVFNIKIMTFSKEYTKLVDEEFNRDQYCEECFVKALEEFSTKYCSSRPRDINMKYPLFQLLDNYLLFKVNCKDEDNYSWRGFGICKSYDRKDRTIIVRFNEGLLYKIKGKSTRKLVRKLQKMMINKTAPDSFYLSAKGTKSAR